MQRLRQLRLSPAAYRRVTLVALVALVAIIVTGAAVRLTDSGLGCPTWPNCEDGSLVPRGETGHHGWVEFVNRVITGAVSVAVVLAVLGSRRREPRRRDLTRWSLGLVAGVLAQGLLGGAVVLLHVDPVAVAGHYLLSAVLVWNAVVLHHKASAPDGAPGPAAVDALREPAAPPAAGPVVRLSRAMVGLGVAVLVSGTLVTGSGPHGGDEAAERLSFAITTVVRLHGVVVWCFLLATLLVLRAAHRAGVVGPVLGRGRFLLGAIVAQGGLGYVQYANGVPELLVGGHVLGSVIVWAAAVRFHLALTSPVPDAEMVTPGPGAPAHPATVPA